MKHSIVIYSHVYTYRADAATGGSYRRQGTLPCRAQAVPRDQRRSLLQKTRDKGISIAVAIRSLDCYYKPYNVCLMCKIFSYNDYSVSKHRPRRILNAWAHTG